jgi:uncharacterized YigZ family protein
MARYRIPKGRARVEIRVSNSRFIATVAPASSTKEAQDFIRGIREEMPDATHHVYAYKIGYGSSISEGLSDAGEPSGTAGPPALAVLRGADVGDVVLVISRYFGGTKLGTGGLVAAYTHAAKAAFEALETEEKVHRIRLSLTIPYGLLERVRLLFPEYECIVEGEDFGAEVGLTLQMPEEQLAEFSRRIRDLSAGKVHLQTLA